MPEVKNSLQISSIASSTRAFQPNTLAVGAGISSLQYLMQLRADEDAPHFVEGQEPVQDGRAYKSTAGQQYYRPQVRIAQRDVPPFGPEVRFLKDAEGKVRLEFELEETPQAGMPADARPFNVRVNQVKLEWLEGSQRKQRLFDRPTLVAQDDEQGSTKPRFFFHVGSELSPDEVPTMHRALSTPSASAKLAVQLTYSYWVDEEPEESGTTGPVLEHPVAIFEPVFRTNEPVIAIDPLLVRRLEQPLTAVEMIPLRRAVENPPSEIVAPASGAALGRVRPSWIRRIDPEFMKTIHEAARERERQPNFRTVKLTRTLDFVFDPNQHRYVFSAIVESETPIEGWTNTDFGMIRQAPFPNTVFRLPDEIRLAYIAEMGAPHVLPALYRDEEDEPRVRVTLRAVPWHDPAQLVKLRDDLYLATRGALANPIVVVGGYEEAKLKLTTAFPEQIHAITEDEATINLRNGFDLTLDLSLEFYRYLAQLLTGPIGVTGEVTVTLETSEPAAGEEPQKLERQVPMRLNLDDLANLPIDVEVDQGAVSPRQIQLINRAGAKMRLSQCIPRLLQWDDNSVIPLEVFQATTTTTFPADLTAGIPFTVEFQPNDEFEGQLWNAAQIELIGQMLEQSAENTLERIHEIAPESTLAWKVKVECPPFLSDPVPESFQNIHRVEVKIFRPGFAPQQVVLGPGQAKSEITMHQTLKDILGEDAGGIGTFTYRVRNIYFDHQGQLGPEQPAEGSNLFVFPNPPEND